MLGYIWIDPGMWWEQKVKTFTIYNNYDNPCVFHFVSSGISLWPMEIAKIIIKKAFELTSNPKHVLVPKLELLIIGSTRNDKLMPFTLEIHGEIIQKEVKTWLSGHLKIRFQARETLYAS